MRWMGALAWRSFVFWGIWTVLCCGGYRAFEQSQQEPNDHVLRLTLFLATVFLVVSETARVDTLLQALGEQLRTAGSATPGRVERFTSGTPLLMVGIACMTLCAGVCCDGFLTPLYRAGRAVGLFATLAAGVAWTVAGQMVFALFLRGFTVLRFRWAARGLPAAKGERLGVVLPWTVAAWSAGSLLLALLGLPDRALVEGVARVALAGIDAVLLEQQAGVGTGEVRLLVRLGPDDQIGEISPILRDLGATASRALPEISAADDPELAATWLVTAPAADTFPIVAFLALDPNDDVASVELDVEVAAAPLDAAGPCRPFSTRLPVSDPLADSQPELSSMGAERALLALARRAPRRPARVALIDTPTASFFGELSVMTTESSRGLTAGDHGTACAGLIAATADNALGVASFNVEGRYVRLVSLPIFGQASPRATDVADAIWDAVEADADVINLSFAGRGVAPDVVSEVIEHALARGAIVVAAAGNDEGHARDFWPANVPGVLAVGATDGLARATFSNRTNGLRYTVSAPGSGVCVLTTDGRYTRASGTSMAAPLVAGALGTMRALCPRLTREEAVDILVTTGDRILDGSLGPSVRIDRALDLLLKLHPECGGYGAVWDEGDD